MESSIDRTLYDKSESLDDEFFKETTINYPNDTAVSSTLGPFNVTTSTTYQSCRARARAVAVKISNTAVDSNWKLGTFRLDVHAGGRR